jgi:hypothetical protein
MGVPLAGFVGPAVALLEFFGGLTLIVGVLTRVAALGLGLTMLGALLLAHLPAGFFLPNGSEFVLSLLGSAVLLALTARGPTRWTFGLRIAVGNWPGPCARGRKPTRSKLNQPPSPRQPAALERRATRRSRSPMQKSGRRTRGASLYESASRKLKHGALGRESWSRTGAPWSRSRSGAAFVQYNSATVLAAQRHRRILRPHAAPGRRHPMIRPIARRPDRRSAAAGGRTERLSHSRRWRRAHRCREWGRRHRSRHEPVDVVRDRRVTARVSRTHQQGMPTRVGRGAGRWNRGMGRRHLLPGPAPHRVASRRGYSLGNSRARHVTVSAGTAQGYAGSVQRSGYGFDSRRLHLARAPDQLIRRP